jgi:DNA-binding PadR family transcriptional regulator
MARLLSDPRSFLPLTPFAFQVLLALAGDARHGYAIIQEVESRTDGLIRLRTGTLYTLLQRLVDEALIEEGAPAEPRGARTSGPRADPRRRYYRLTALGRAVLAAEAERLQGLVAEARRRRVIRAPGA